MPRAGSFLAASAALYAATTIASAAESTPPVFSPSPNTGWVSYGSEFLPPPSGPKPVTFDPNHPFVPDCVEFRVARPDVKCPNTPTTFRVADLNNPILQPWAREELRKRNEDVLAGKPGYTRQTSCWPLGTPGYLLYIVQPVFIVQSAKEVLFITQYDQMVRHVYLNVPHSEKVKPSWFGESVGHYEGDSLVVDTIGMNAKTYVDNYRTPHTDRLHVVERYRLTDDGKTLVVNLRVEDPGAFTSPWNAQQRYSRVELGPIVEMKCAENNPDYFQHDVEPMPEAKTPDF